MGIYAMNHCIAYSIWGLNKTGVSPNWTVGHMPAFRDDLSGDLLLAISEVSSSSPLPPALRFVTITCPVINMFTKSVRVHTSFLCTSLSTWNGGENPCHLQNSKELSACCRTHWKSRRTGKIAQTWVSKSGEEERGIWGKETAQMVKFLISHAQVHLQKNSSSQAGCFSLLDSLSG